MNTGIGGHNQTEGLSVEWLTPPGIIDRLGPFDLDPCAPVDRPWPMAVKHLTFLDDGLSHLWEGRVWLNPPYDKSIGTWLRRLADHGNGIALVFARTETDWFFDKVWQRAHAVYFLRKRLNFYRCDGARSRKNSGGPSCLVAYGVENQHRLATCGLNGKLVTLK